MALFIAVSNDKSSESSGDPWRNCSKSVLQGLSDQALITALAITIGALSYGLDGFDAYHFELTLDLASLAIAVHMLSLMVNYINYKDELKEGGGRVVRWILWVWRRFWLFVTTIMIIFLWAFGTWSPTLPNCPARCRGLGDPPRTGWDKLRTYTVLLIIINNILFPAVVEMPRIFGHDRPPIERYKWVKSLVRVFHSGYKILYAVSFCVAAGSCCCAAALSIHNYRQGSSLLSGDELSLERTFGFGQIIPLLLFMLPTMAAASAIAGQS